MNYLKASPPNLGLIHSLGNPPILERFGQICWSPSQKKRFLTVPKRGNSDFPNTHCYRLASLWEARWTEWTDCTSKFVNGSALKYSENTLYVIELLEYDPIYRAAYILYYYDPTLMLRGGAHELSPCFRATPRRYWCTRGANLFLLIGYRYVFPDRKEATMLCNREVKIQ